MQIHKAGTRASENQSQPGAQANADAAPPAAAAHRHFATNNFDAIRVVAASLVLYSHHYALTAQTEPSFFHLHSFGGMSVIAFFIISGYLVTGSWYHDPNFVRFSMRRILRIWPALTLVVVGTAYGLGPWITELPVREYVFHRATFDYLGTLWMKVHYQLPGVFPHNPYPAGVNGSLWTIPLEVRCYIVLALLGLFKLLKRRQVFLVFIFIYWLWFIQNSSPDITGKVHYGRELAAFFLAGAALQIAQPHWEHRPCYWAAALAAGAAGLWYFGWKYTALLVGMPFFIVYFGTRSWPFFRRFGRWGDPSYGIYLIAFPVQQTVILYAWPDLGFVGTLCLAMVITTTLAYASWHCLEKQALKFKPRRQ